MFRLALPYRVPLMAGLVAVVAAGALAVTLERQSALEQRQRAQQMARHACERTAAALATKLREAFGGALVDSIESIHHQELKAYNLARIDRFLDEGMRRYPYVTRFFFWHERLPAHLSDQVLFYRPRGEPGRRDIGIADGGGALGAFYSDPARGEEIWQTARDLMEHGRSFGVEERIVAGGRYQLVFHLLWDGASRDRIFGAIGFMVELDMLRQTAFASVVESLMPVLAANADGVPLSLQVVDQRGESVYGRSPAVRDPAGSDAIDVLFFPRELLGVYASIPRVEQWRLTVTPAEESASGNRSSLALLAAVILLLAVAVICAMSVNRQAVRLSELQSEFVANVTHQLRTPLAMVSGAAETLRLERVRSPEKVKEYADIVQTQARRLSVLVDEILHFHRAELVDPTRFGQLVDLSALVARVVEQHRDAAAAASVAVSVEGLEAAPMVRGDGIALEAVLSSLIENAIKYRQGRGADAVCVSVGADRRFAVVAVRDSGVGISRADLPHIFDKFYRGRTGSQSRPGFGLGLAIVRATVAGHGGRIAVDSEADRGSRFTIWLPLAV